MVIKLDKNEITYSHTVNMQERKSIIITGCKKIENLDDEERAEFKKVCIVN